MNSFDAVIIGAGQAGIATSFLLQQRQISHVVVEKNRAFSEWYGRWDSFHMNTANFMNALPGASVEFAPGASRNAQGTKADAIRYFEAYLSAVDPLLREGVEVVSVRQGSDNTWRVVTEESIYEAQNVVIATGALRHPKIPPIAHQLPEAVPQMHSREYRNPEQIKSAHVLVVGSGSSGVQICAELARSERFDRVTFAVSGVLISPLEIMGIPILPLMKRLGILDLRAKSWLGKRLGKADRGYPTFPPSPKQLANMYGVELVGKVTGIDGSELQCSDGRTVPLESLCVVWCTGFREKHDFIELANRVRAFDASGRPIHDRGVVSAAPGLYFVGLVFQYTLFSQDIYGVGRDAEHVAQHIATRHTVEPSMDTPSGSAQGSG
ncbi:MAG: NAD(P)/FAD-dependent oxidoreductase [Chloroflexi bacterium]|nr:NAD(P)/FAD-dependent oxidoreductase [Chloroflexota bacterium]